MTKTPLRVVIIGAGTGGLFRSEWTAAYERYGLVECSFADQ